MREVSFLEVNYSLSDKLNVNEMQRKKPPKGSGRWAKSVILVGGIVTIAVRSTINLYSVGASHGQSLSLLLTQNPAPFTQRSLFGFICVCYTDTTLIFRNVFSGNP